MANYAESGGFWNAPKAQYSQQTHNLLKEMMQESKLTNFQQRQLQNQMRSGGSLPVQCHPTSSARRKEPAPPKPLPKVLNPKNYHSNGVRSKEVIEQSGAYERPKYEPGPSHWFKNSEKEKEKLANQMAFGQDLPPPSEARRIKRKPKQVEFDDEPPIDRFDELQMEIDERRQFLQDMENLGQAEKHRPVIETQISQILNEIIKDYNPSLDAKSFLHLESHLLQQKLTTDTLVIIRLSSVATDIGEGITSVDTDEAKRCMKWFVLKD